MFNSQTLESLGRALGGCLVTADSDVFTAHCVTLCLCQAKKRLNIVKPEYAGDSLDFCHLLVKHSCTYARPVSRQRHYIRSIFTAFDNYGGGGFEVTKKNCKKGGGNSHPTK